MATSIVEGFSISNAAILDGTTGADAVGGDIYGVREGSLAIDMGNYDNTGDDAVLSSWFWFNYATVTIKSGFIPFALLALITGDGVVSSGAAPNDIYSTPLWTQSSLNQSPKPMLLRIPSKDSGGVVRALDIVLYKCVFEPIQFEGPVYKTGITVDYTARALISQNDEKGAVLTKPAIGRLVSSAPALSEPLPVITGDR